MKIKHVLISQPPPENDKSPYADLMDEYNLGICFRKFIKIESIGAREFRKHRINIPEFTAIIFTSKNAIDHFFSLCEELRVQISEQMKYFCTSEAIALYLQKYVQFRKRKIFFREEPLLGSSGCYQKRTRMKGSFSRVQKTIKRIYRSC